MQHFWNAHHDQNPCGILSKPLFQHFLHRCRPHRTNTSRMTFHRPLTLLFQSHSEYSSSKFCSTKPPKCLWQDIISNLVQSSFVSIQFCQIRRSLIHEISVPSWSGNSFINASIYRLWSIHVRLRNWIERKRVIVFFWHSPFAAWIGKWLYNTATFRRLGKTIANHENSSILLHLIQTQNIYWLPSVFCILTGLYVEDTYDDIPVVREALNRLEVCQPDVFDLRNQRINRAYDLNYRKETLPKEQWTQYDKDIRYLTPYMAEVQREWDEKADFNRNNA